MEHSLILGIATIEDLLLNHKLTECDSDKLGSIGLSIPEYQRPYKPPKEDTPHWATDFGYNIVRIGRYFRLPETERPLMRIRGHKTETGPNARRGGHDELREPFTRAAGEGPGVREP